MITVNTREDFLIELNKLLPEQSLGVEIGVLHGDFSKIILDVIKPARLVLIDPYSEGETSYANGLNTAYSNENDFDKLIERFEKELKSRQVIVYRNFSCNSVRSFSNSVLNFIYFDGSHLYEDTKRDLTDWLPKIKEGGLVCGHDYADIADFGVIKAVNEFMKEYNFEMVLFNDNGGDWALRKIN